MLFWRRDGLVAADEFGAAGTVGDRYVLTPGRYAGAADTDIKGTAHPCGWASARRCYLRGGYLYCIQLRNGVNDQSCV
jgi:hypothetical protein